MLEEIVKYLNKCKKQLHNFGTRDTRKGDDAFSISLLEALGKGVIDSDVESIIEEKLREEEPML